MVLHVKIGKQDTFVLKISAYSTLVAIFKYTAVDDLIAIHFNLCSSILNTQYFHIYIEYCSAKVLIKYCCARHEGRFESDDHLERVGRRRPPSIDQQQGPPASGVKRTVDVQLEYCNFKSKSLYSVVIWLCIVQYCSIP